MKNFKIFFQIRTKNDNAFSMIFEELQTIEKSYEEDSTITDMLIQKAI